MTKSNLEYTNFSNGVYIFGNNIKRFYKMSIKSDTSLIRGLLYLNEVIEHKTINKAAEINGIKPSNLSLLLSDLEKQMNAKLLIRTPQGCIPTATGKLFFNLTVELKNFISEIKENCILPHKDTSLLKVFISQNLDFCDFSDFEKEFPEIKTETVTTPNEADFLILNTLPKLSGISYSEFNIGSKIKQKIWLCCRENCSDALCFFDFIVAKLLPICVQPVLLSSEDSDSLDEK